MTEGHGGPARGYSWEPFQPGHTVSLIHGAYSERRVGPRAAALAEGLLADPGTPAYLKTDPTYGPAILAWARAEAIATLLFEWIAGQDFERSMTDVTIADETETRTGKSGVKRLSTSRRMEAALVQLHRAENRAMALRAALGLTPASRARMPKRFGQPTIDLASMLAQEQARGRYGQAEGDGEAVADAS